MTEPYQLACVLLAAGCSRRFGSPKQLAQINGQPMLLNTLKRLDASNVNNIFVALGANNELVADFLPENIQKIQVEHWQNGLGKSIAESVCYIADMAFTHVMIALADQVAITSKDFNLLVETGNRYPEQIVVARYKGMLGVPGIFPRRYFESLQELDGDKGAKAFLIQNTEQVKEVSMPLASIDIDTPEELAAWLSKNGAS